MKHEALQINVLQRLFLSLENPRLCRGFKKALAVIRK